jgi:hypothetical protein
MRRREDLLHTARRAFERGRAVKAARTGLLVVPMFLVSCSFCSNRGTSSVFAGVLMALVAVLVWRGGTAERAVAPGLVSGVLPLALALLACPACDRLAGGAAPGAWSLSVCVVGGVLSGALVARFASRDGVRGREGAPSYARASAERATFLVSAGAIAALVGSLGCMIMGLGGVAAMVAGLAAIAVPAGLWPAKAS